MTRIVRSRGDSEQSGKRKAYLYGHLSCPINIPPSTSNQRSYHAVRRGQMSGLTRARTRRSIWPCSARP